MQHTFLIEITTEELPSKILQSLAESFTDKINIELNTARIKYGSIKWFATPRRLAVLVSNMHSMQNDSFIDKLGPPIIHSFDLHGKPTKIANKWANKYGIDINKAEQLITDKGKWLLYRMQIKGKPVKLLLYNIVNTAINKLSNFQMMRWGNQKIKFIRPIHNIILLLDNQTIPGNILGININRIVHGHRFMGENKIYLEHANNYLLTLQQRGKVIVDYHQRQSIILGKIEAISKSIGGILNINNNLLNEVTSLVEWPIVLAANFNKKFLAIPTDILVYIMQISHKCFPIYDNTGKLLPNFIIVANLESKKPQCIITGNEIVMHSRFSDAEFFLKSDQKKRLMDYLPLLKNLLFQKKLGNMYNKSKRISSLAAWIAENIGANIQCSARAALLCKCDLMTKMVFEFPDMQGIIGMYYARSDNESEEVVLAQKEHYQPKSSNDTLPTTLVSCAVAIADKIDTLVGMFGINYCLQNDNDPFALRRSAIGILRIIIEKKLQLDLQILIEKVVNLYNDLLINTTVVQDVINFIITRCYSWYQEKKYNVNIVRVVLSKYPTKPIDFDTRIRVISNLHTLQEFTIVSSAMKRIANIISQYNKFIPDNVQFTLMKEPDEIRLNNHLIILQKKIPLLIQHNYYKDALLEIATLHSPLNDFFKNVMVMTKEPILQTNRITLLNKLYDLFSQVIDVSLI